MESSSGTSSLLPRFAERLKIPPAAFGLKKKRAEAWVTNTCHKKDSDPSLGHAEVLAVQNSVLEVRIPAFDQRRENESEVTSSIAGKKSLDIFKDDKTSSNCDCELKGVPVQPASLSIKSLSIGLGQADVLAREPTTDDINLGSLFTEPPVGSRDDIVVSRHVRPMPFQHGQSKRMLLHLTDTLQAGLLEAEIEASGQIPANRLTKVGL